MTNKKIIYIEKPSHFLWITCLILKLFKYEIKIFNFNHNLKNYFLLKKLIEKKILIPLVPLNISKLHKVAIEKSNNIINGIDFKEFHPLNLLYSSQEVKLIYKKSLAFSILEEMEILDNLNLNDKLFNSSFKKKFNISLTKYLKLNYLKIKLLNPLSNFHMIIEILIWKFCAVVYILSVSLIYFIHGLFGKSIIRKNFKHIVSIDQIFQVKFEDKRSFDFILDEKNIKKKDTLFLITCKINKDWLKNKLISGYNIVHLDDLTKFFSSKKYRYPLIFYKNIFKSLISFIFTKHSSSCFLKSYIKCVYNFFKWQPIFYHFNFENYIYTNQESIKQICKNILLKKNKVKVWNYSSFVGGGLLISKNNSFDDVHNVLFSFQNADFYFVCNSDVKAYFQKHFFHNGKIYVVGNIYSQMAWEYSSNTKFKNKIVNTKNFNIKQNMNISDFKTISFFDTTFINDNNCLTSFKDCINFYDDIYYLSEKFKDKILIIIKNSKNKNFYVNLNNEWSNLEIGSKIIEKWELLKRQNNVYFAGDSGNVPLIISESDLVITHCMSSTCIEALGAGKISLWYESNNKHSDINYKKIPGLVLNGYNQLEELVTKLLNSNINYNEFFSIIKKNNIVSENDKVSLDLMRQRIAKSFYAN